MKCLIISTFEQAGGAARSAHRLYRQSTLLGVDCRMLVQYKNSDDPLIFGPDGWLNQKAGMLRPYLDALPLLCYRSRLSPPWSLAWLPKGIEAGAANFSPDIIHLHGIGHGFLPIRTIKRLDKPLIWTLHDSWAFTGGCHLPGACTRYSADCGCCPQLNSRHESDLSRWGWLRKANCWPKLDVTFIAPSRWMARCARSSSLLDSMPIEVVPNGIDAQYFMPGDRAIARISLGLPQQGIVLLYGASSFTRDKNKGFLHLKCSLSLVAARLGQRTLTVVVFGDSNYQDTEIEGISVRSYGSVATDEKLISLYRAADFFVLPSLQENLPNTVMEAMSCGTPCVAFDVGGVSELVSHGANGFIAEAASEKELAEGIMWMIDDDGRRAKLGRQARKTIENGFSLIEVADQHRSLYSRILNDSRKVVSRTMAR